MLTPVVARNLAGPAVVELDDWHWTVLEIVSIAFAVTYVPKYRAEIRRNGRDLRKWLGLVKRVPTEVRIEVRSATRPEAFSIIALRTSQ